MIVIDEIINRFRKEHCKNEEKEFMGRNDFRIILEHTCDVGSNLF